MPADLAAIQARADAATEGPWAWEATGEKDNSWAVGQIQDDDGNPIEGENEPGENIVIEGICEGIDGHIPDAAFIAGARTDVPALVAELRAARETVNQISVLLDTSPIGPTRADLAILATQIRQVIDNAREAAADAR